MTGSSIEVIVRDYYRAYESSDRALIDQLLSPEFTFSSPVDDAIDRTTYLAKCWPFHKLLDRFHLEQLAVDGEDALVRYQAQEHDGNTFRNVEHLVIRDGRSTQVDVYGALSKPRTK